MKKDVRVQADGFFINPVRKIFSVIIHNEEYWVYDLDGREHEGLNGEPKTWWLYYSKLPDENLTPPIDSKDFTPFTYSISRFCWDISFKQKNTCKVKWDDFHFSSNTTCEMRCNNKLIYSFYTWGDDKGMSFALAKVEYLKPIMHEHPFDFFNPEKEQGRKIWWYGLPAMIRIPDREEKWEIGIIPDYTCGLDKESWWKELENRKSNYNEIKDDDDDIFDYDEEDKNQNFINWGDALEDKHIGWFR